MGTDESPHVCTRFSPLPFFAPASILSSRNAFIRDLALIQHRLYQKMESVPIIIPPPSSLLLTRSVMSHKDYIIIIMPVNSSQSRLHVHFSSRSTINDYGRLNAIKSTILFYITFILTIQDYTYIFRNGSDTNAICVLGEWEPPVIG